MNDSAYTLHFEQAENRDKNGKFKKGRTPWNKGLTWDEQGMPKEQQEERKRRFNEAGIKAKRKRDKPQKSAIPVIQMDEQGNRLHWYASSTIAATKLNLQARNIRYVCQGKRHYCGGFRWKYDELFLT
jgi:hypothetical protein